jgi:hypothetical protein
MGCDRFVTSSFGRTGCDIFNQRKFLKNPDPDDDGNWNGWYITRSPSAVWAYMEFRQGFWKVGSMAYD